ncbi:hypothetical protein ACFXGT_09145 [Streptomyces sp. NPDC059352]|uniref:hypothetical protein n=1 Tax=Streptomyces sp. NPDC059352 TaxID=3346810 RepID=UPI0036B20814
MLTADSRETGTLAPDHDDHDDHDRNDNGANGANGDSWRRGGGHADRHARQVTVRVV